MPTGQHQVVHHAVAQESPYCRSTLNRLARRRPHRGRGGVNSLPRLPRRPLAVHICGSSSFGKILAPISPTPEKVRVRDSGCWRNGQNRHNGCACWPGRFDRSRQNRRRAGSVASV